MLSIWIMSKPRAGWHTLFFTEERPMRARGKTSMLLTASAVFAILLAASATADDLVTGKNQSAVLHLGKIDVHGQRTIVKELQAIKVALQQHFSDDPKQADTVVCTLESQADSHIMQRLSCATNRGWAQQRDGIQTNMAYAQQAKNVRAGLPNPRLLSKDATACSTSACYEEAISPMDETLAFLPAHYLQVTVDGAALHTLLQKIPYPAARKHSTYAPAAQTRHQP
jgi:hypothetical protein